ncbi:MAG: type II secretion system F family protein [Intrasporangium sp.]|uniref:type II secretion system F family protein n=1 Tax=Intrasporangium sp. TaxID=1925024 RepID=UPI002649BB0D|nr:type II secretion system F family protein [Intrasporangium sp.]MDN5795019.1 type II secretion system F family protein [Intrasporangium sp.]
MIRATLRRVAVAMALALALAAVPATAASAADPVTVGISQVAAKDATVTGILTLRSRSSVRVDPASVKATIDGRSAPVTIKQAPRLQRRAMLVIDTSGSMGAAGMATVRTATARYLKDVPADVLVGVVTFADTAGVDLAPTTNRAAAQRVVDGLVARGDTSLYAAMRSAVTALGKTGDRSIVLLSDGADTIAADRAKARATVTRALGSAGVRSDVVQFKTTDPDAASALKGFAAANGGSVVPAGNTAAVTAAFHESAKALDAQVQFTVTTRRTATGTKTLTIAGVAAGTPFSFTRSVTFDASVAAPGTAGSTAPAAPATAAPAPTVAGPTPPLPAAQSQPWLLWLALLLVGIALFAGILAATTPTLQTTRERRVGSIETYVAATRGARSKAKTQPTALSEQLIGFGDRYMQGRKSTKRTMALIERADLPFRAGEWFVIVSTAVVTGSALGALLLGGGPIGGTLGLALGGLLGLMLPTVFLHVRANRRARAFERVLPDVLTLVATSLRSGFGLPQALDAVARDAADPAAKEFSRALAETRIGTDIADALERMATRMDSTNMRWAVMAIRIQREVGGNLADTLKTTAATLRERENLQRQVRTLSAEGRLSAYLLIALPIGLFFHMMMVNHEYISRLWTNPLGIVMALVAVLLLVLGAFWMRRVVRIEV